MNIVNFGKCNCCANVPSSSGIAGAMVACCTSPLPLTLYATIGGGFSGGAGCTCFVPPVVPITWDGISAWRSAGFTTPTSNTCGTPYTETWQIVLVCTCCDGLGNTLFRVTMGCTLSSGGYAASSWDWVSDDSSCNPLYLEFLITGDTCCRQFDSSFWTIVITP